MHSIKVMSEDTTRNLAGICGTAYLGFFYHCAHLNRIYLSRHLNAFIMAIVHTNQKGIFIELHYCLQTQVRLLFAFM